MFAPTTNTRFQAPTPSTQSPTQSASLPAGLSRREVLPHWYPHLPLPPHSPPGPVMAPPRPRPPVLAPLTAAHPRRLPGYAQEAAVVEHLSRISITSLQPLFRQAWYDAPIHERTRLAQRWPMLRPLTSLMENYAEGSLPWQWLPVWGQNTAWADMLIAVVIGKGVGELSEWIKGAFLHPSFHNFVARGSGPPLHPEYGTP